MNISPNEKSRDGDRGIDSKDSDGQASIRINTNPLIPTKLVVMLSLLQHFQEVANAYALETDNPVWGVLEAADYVDAAYDELAFALQCGGTS